MNLDLDGMNITQFLYASLSYARAADSREEEYMFELGAAVINKLISEDNYLFKHYIDEVDTLWGVPVRINYHNPDMFKLWKDITND